MTATASETGQTARILAFPLRERTVSMVPREQMMGILEAEARRAPVAVSEGWYHAEAVKTGA